MKRLPAIFAVAIVLQAAPTSAGLLDAFNGSQIGHAPAALAGIMGNGIAIARALFNILVVSSLVAAFAKTVIETRSIESFGFALSRVFWWLVGPMIVFNAAVGLLPNIGTFFLNIASVFTGNAGGAGLVTPYAILAEGSAIGLALIAAAARVTDLGPGIPFVFGPAAFMGIVAYAAAFVVAVCFVAITAVLIKNIWGLFVFAAVGAWKVALLGAEVTSGQGWGYIFALLGKGSVVITAVIMVTIVANEARTWPAFIAGATLENFISRGMEVDGAALFCAFLTYGVASEVGLAFLVNMAVRKLPS